MNEEKSNLDSDVILAYLKLSRTMRRCPPERKDLPFPPAVGRLLECAAANPGVSSRELCEALDLRPSSLSEILVRAENDGLLCRTVDENDRRVQRVSLTPGGSAVVADMEKVRNEDAKKKTSCLTEEEKKQFCSLCNRLSEHIEKLALELPEGLMPDHPGLHHSGPRHPGEDRPGPEGPGRPPFPPGGRFRC
ncbi:MAG: winged helix-turn-helix transcriptional regulator [Clostridia bacterium]|nr:winged helix-turn-helix transcriptional regulator [Clostridia bacterium]